MKLKRILVAAIAALMLIGCVACNNNSSNSGDGLDLHNYHLVKIHGGYRAFLGNHSLHLVTVKSVIIIEKVHVAIDCFSPFSPLQSMSITFTV